MKEPKLLVNQAKCLICNDIIQSKYTHDYVTCSCGNLSVDGGISYAKRGIANGTESYEDLCLYSTDLHNKLRKYFCWGTYGKDGKSPLKYIPLQDLTIPHIKAILETQKHISQEVHDLLVNELQYRKDFLGYKEGEKK